MIFSTLPAAERAAGKIPGARLIVYDNGGHLLVGHERDTRAAVRAFLTDRGLLPPPDGAARTGRQN